jgi:hypothetical protein
MVCGVIARRRMDQTKRGKRDDINEFDDAY